MTWVLLAALIGYALGCMHMRGNYLHLLRRAQIEKARAMRYVETRATHERYLGYAVGFRDGARN